MKRKNWIDNALAGWIQIMESYLNWCKDGSRVVKLFLHLALYFFFWVLTMLSLMEKMIGLHFDRYPQISPTSLSDPVAKNCQVKSNSHMRPQFNKWLETILVLCNSFGFHDQVQYYLKQVFLVPWFLKELCAAGIFTEVTHGIHFSLRFSCGGLLLPKQYLAI